MANNTILSTFELLQHKLFLMAYRMLGEREAAEDAVQDTFLRLWKNRERLPNTEELPPYMMRTTKNICIDSLRTAQREVLDIGENISNTGISESVERSLEINEELEQVKRWIAQELTPMQRKVIEMRDIDGFELEEIALHLGIAPGAVRMNLSRARKTLRELYNKQA